MHGRCHVRTEVEWIQRCCTEFRYDYLNGSVTPINGRLANTTVQSNCLFKVMDQETCQEQNIFVWVRIVVGAQSVQSTPKRHHVRTYHEPDDERRQRLWGKSSQVLHKNREGD